MNFWDALPKTSDNCRESVVKASQQHWHFSRKGADFHAFHSFVINIPLTAKVNLFRLISTTICANELKKNIEKSFQLSGSGLRSLLRNQILPFLYLLSISLASPRYKDITNSGTKLEQFISRQHSFIATFVLDSFLIHSAQTSFTRHSLLFNTRLPPTRPSLLHHLRLAPSIQNIFSLPFNI